MHTGSLITLFPYICSCEDIVLTFHKAGGVFVDSEVEKMLKRKLEGSSFSDQKNIKSMIDAFEEVSSPLRAIGGRPSSDHPRKLKPEFDGKKGKYDLKFGPTSDNDPTLGIHKGKITLSNQELKPIFDAVINKIVTSCSRIIVNHRAEVRQYSRLLHAKHRPVCFSRWWIGRVTVSANNSCTEAGQREND
jgi:hypothetical protein